MINDEIKIALAQCKIPERQILEYNFEDIAYIQKEDCGVYVIHQDQRPIYVGKGKVKKRNISHWMKTNGRVKEKGWKYLIDNKQTLGIDFDKFKISYVSLREKKQETAVEGLLILNLDPLANSESFFDKFNR